VNAVWKGRRTGRVVAREKGTFAKVKMRGKSPRKRRANMGECMHQKTALEMS